MTLPRRLLALGMLAGVLVHAAVGADDPVARFRELWQAGEGGAAAEKYLRSLPPTDRLAVARAVLRDRDARLGYVGASVLVQEGHADEAVPALAAMITDGRVATDHVRLGYDWLHSDDDGLYPRMTAKIGRHLLAHLGEYDAQDRARAEEYLMGGQQPFSRAAAEHRLAEMEEATGTKAK
jgi:hypothetical protein